MIKKILLSVLIQAPVLLFAQNNFNLKGEIQNIAPTKKIYLVHVENQREILDSAAFNNGKFEFNINLNTPSIAILLLDHSGRDLTSRDTKKDIIRFFISPGNANLVAKDSVYKAQISGLPIIGDYEKYLAIVKPLEEKLVGLNTEFAALSDNDKNKQAEVFQAKYEAFLSDRRRAIGEFILTKPNSFVSLYVLNSDLAIEDMDINLVESSYAKLSDELKKDNLAKAINIKLELAKRTSIGVMAPDFEEKTAEQIAIKLSTFKGQYVLVDFWASWCGPCRQENPNVVRAYETFKDKNFTILGVSIDEKPDAWTKAVKADGLVWTQLLDRTDKIAELYGINAIPKNFLVDPNGKIIAKNLRGPGLMEKLSEVFKAEKKK
jgi:peroxiredoxin